MRVETPQRERTYGPGNPHKFKLLGENDYKNPVYLRGKALFETGNTPVKDGVFVQIWTLEPGEGREVACLSRDVVWDGQTKIEGYGEALVRDIAGREVDDDQWYGDEYTAFIVGDLDPEELVNRLIYSPAKIYREYLENLTLAEAAQRDEVDYERDFLHASYAKGRRFVGISNGRISGQESAFQEGQGRGFAWGYRKNSKGKLEAIRPGETKSQTLDELAFHPLAGQDIQDNLLDTQDFFRGSSKKRRTAIKFTLHITRPCCLFATAAQSYSATNFYKTPGFESTSEILQSETNKLFPELLSREVTKCSNCKQPKVSGQDHVCQKEENKV